MQFPCIWTEVKMFRRPLIHRDIDDLPRIAVMRLQAIFPESNQTFILPAMSQEGFRPK